MQGRTIRFVSCRLSKRNIQKQIFFIFKVSLIRLSNNLPLSWIVEIMHSAGMEWWFTVILYTEEPKPKARQAGNYKRTTVTGKKRKKLQRFDRTKKEKQLA